MSRLPLALIISVLKSSVDNLLVPTIPYSFFNICLNSVLDLKSPRGLPAPGLRPPLPRLTGGSGLSNSCVKEGSLIRGIAGTPDCTISICRNVTGNAGGAGKGVALIGSGNNGIGDGGGSAANPSTSIKTSTLAGGGIDNGVDCNDKTTDGASGGLGGLYTLASVISLLTSSVKSSLGSLTRPKSIL